MNITEFIENNEVLSELPYLIVFRTIIELIDKGIVDKDKICIKERV